MKFASYLDKKLLLPGLLDGTLYELDIQDPEKNDCWSYLKRVKQSFGVPVSWKSLPDILQDTKWSDRQTAYIGGNVFEISWFIEKSSGYYGPVGWRWMPQWYRRTLGGCPCSKMTLVISGVLEFSYNAHPVYLGDIISFWSLWWSWRIYSYNFP